ncbi:ATP-dependent DNA helicase recg [Phtheirospermum japonicum]|uniref:ATP-dependent DNA helicase recg n=1 Tax=Phtheirospermum japonicum TaxID=374723 RepID=A0A830BWT1_9LAMI|nr:ATP-dependent DNA helicase recg [Phtheirospermum japonicum]
MIEECVPNPVDANWLDQECMYKDLHSLMLRVEIDDGQYLIFVGKIKSSRFNGCTIKSTLSQAVYLLFMSVTTLDVHMSSMGFSEKCLRHAVNFETERACRIIFGKSLSFLPPYVLTSSFRSKHKFTEKLLKGVDGYEKEPVLMGYNGLDDLIGNDTYKEKFRENLKAGNINFDATLASKKFPSISNAEVEIDDGQYLIFVGKIKSSRGIRASSSFAFLEVIVACEVRTMRNKDHFEMREYNIDVVKDEGESSVFAKGRPYPIYPSKKGLNPEFLRDIISRALKTLPDDLDPLPKDVTRDFQLLSLSDAYIGIHQPTDLSMADLARKRLIFDEFFYLQLGKLYQMLEGLGTKLEKYGLLERYTKPELNTVFMEGWSSITKKFMNVLPYKLTSSQLSATSEIIWDLKRPVPMNRLLQGDVGCGKTVVAFLACMEVIGSGYQAAFMVPTELLAIQHYEHLLGFLEKIEESGEKPSVALLTGSTPTKQAQSIRKSLLAGNISMVIGTHTLIAEKVEFSALRIAIVDEQHRFAQMTPGKMMSPWLHMFSPCQPRLYRGRLLWRCTITDLPPGRTPVKTYVIEGNEVGYETAYQMMFEELGDGGKVYIVYPVIEQSEQLPQLRAASADFETISEKFSNYKCGLLHGRMKGEEKDDALKRFRSGETNILLATQVIEIGVDVPDASMMVVMNAERFGIAQLHQLRGRVGRGERKSKCILLASTASSLKRLKVLEKSSDGFYLANMDLVLRGPGDLLGKKQSGHLPEFPVARLEKVLESSDDLAKYPDLKAELSMRQPLCPLGD